MLNLLPLQEKKKTLTEYRLRFFAFAVFTLGALIVANLALLTPSYLLAVSKYDSISADLAARQAKQGIGGQAKTIDGQVRAVNKKIALFSSDGSTKRVSPADVNAKIIEIKSAAIKIQSFSYDASGPQERIVVSGLADDRDSLAAFVDALKKEGTFSSVDLPVSSYVKSTNIDFSIALVHGQASGAIKN